MSDSSSSNNVANGNTNDNNNSTAHKKKKNKKKGTGENNNANNTSDDNNNSVGLSESILNAHNKSLQSEPVNELSQQLALNSINALANINNASNNNNNNTTSTATSHEYKFWSTQPVPRLDASPDILVSEGPIETKSLSDISTTPYALPQHFEWCSIDISNVDQVLEVYKLLSENYVEDDDNMFRFDYSKEFLQWALQPPGFRKEWHVGVRMTSNNKLYAFISGVPDMRVYSKVIKMVEINFLCVHKKLRSKRLAPVLIKEITRRVNLVDIWQAVYTAGVVLPKPVAQNRYYHRSLNPKKLIEIGFSRLAPRMTIARTIKLYKLPDKPQICGIRAMQSKDVPQLTKLLNNYLNSFQLAQQFTEADVSHILTPRENVVYCYVVENNDTKQITDFTSFYSLPSTIIGNEKYNTLRAAYSFYNVTTQHSWNDLITDSLILAKNNDFDVFNALNVMQNDEFLTKLKFGQGDGTLNYYVYNYRCPPMNASQVGLVLL